MNTSGFKRLRFIFIISLSVMSYASGQDTLHTSLSDLLDLAGMHNRQIEMMRMNTEIANIDYDKSKAVFLPVISLENSAVFTTNPLNAFGFKLQQEKIRQSDFQPDLLNDPDLTELYTTKLELKQPILNFDGIHARKAAQSMAQSLEQQMNRAVWGVEFEIERAYRQLQLMYASIDVLKSARRTAQENLNISQNLLEEGFIKKADELEVRLHLSDIDNQLISMANNIKITSQAIQYLIGLPTNEIIMPMESIEQQIKIIDADELTLLSRSDILAYDKAIEARQHMIHSNKKKKLPRLNAMGSYQWNDDGFLGFSAGSYTFGFNLSWNVFNGGKDMSDIRKSELEFKRLQVERDDAIAKSKMKLHNEMKKLENLNDRINVLKRAIEHAAESLRIRNNLYEQGYEKTNDVLKAETNLSQKKLDLLNTITEYNIHKAKVEYILEKEL